MRRPFLRDLAFGIALVATAAPAEALEPVTGATTVERVRIVDFRFRPRSLTIDRGTVVRWKNRGTLNHTSTSDVWDSGTLSPGETFQRRFRRRGPFDYFCDIHSSMTATITVV